MSRTESEIINDFNNHADIQRPTGLAQFVQTMQATQKDVNLLQGQQPRLSKGLLEQFGELQITSGDSSKPFAAKKEEADNSKRTEQGASDAQKRVDGHTTINQSNDRYQAPIQPEIRYGADSSKSFATKDLPGKEDSHNSKRTEQGPSDAEKRVGDYTPLRKHDEQQDRTQQLLPPEVRYGADSRPVTDKPSDNRNPAAAQEAAQQRGRSSDKPATKTDFDRLLLQLSALRDMARPQDVNQGTHRR